MIEIVFHLVGALGSALIILSYALCQARRIDITSATANWINLSGAILLTFSLIYNFNLGSFIIEMFWIGIALYGLYRNYSTRVSGLS